MVFALCGSKIYNNPIWIAMKTYYIFNVPFMGNRKDQIVVADAHGQIYLDAGVQRTTLSVSDVRNLCVGGLIEKLYRYEELYFASAYLSDKWLESAKEIDGVMMGRKPKIYNGFDYSETTKIESIVVDSPCKPQPILSAKSWPLTRSLQEINEMSDAE